MTRLPSIFQAPNRPPRSYEASWGLILFAWPCRFWKCNVFGNRTGRKEDIAKSWEPGKLIFFKKMLASSLRSSTSGLRGRMRPVEASFCSLDHAEFRNVTILGIGPPEVKISLKNTSSLMMIKVFRWVVMRTLDNLTPSSATAKILPNILKTASNPLLHLKPESDPGQIWACIPDPG